MSDIALAGVSKHWRTAQGVVHAVDDLHFSLDAGTLNVLLGPSGCGKSTTLRLIAGLESADGGTITISGRDVTRLPPAQRNIAMVFQSYALFPHLSVAENIVFGLRVRNVGVRERTERLRRVADLLGLEALLARKPSQLSGGQQQRVALGRAIINEAPVCLMDEPLSNLDAKLRAEMRGEIRALQRKLGITMVYVTHDQIEAMSMADRVILLNAGRIEQNGPPAELYDEPGNTFVARFIGMPPMNLFALVPHDGGAAIDGTGGPPLLPRECAGGVLGVRPEHIALRQDDGLAATVEAVEYLGGDSLVACRVGMVVASVRTQGVVAFTRGDPVRLSWAGGAQHYFDASGVKRPLPVEQRSTMFA
ncbi:MAG TPA: ABC transporter ATP-binding protein [Casimicrobiaceae bacterium]|nr:ABC transporter ATP-binding protein [Casimicrobiaceae bacterium]